jgi:hypothetical protein
MTTELQLSSDKIKVSEQKVSVLPNAAKGHEFYDYEKELIYYWTNNNKRDWSIYSKVQFVRFWDARVPPEVRSK